METFGDVLACAFVVRGCGDAVKAWREDGWSAGLGALFGFLTGIAVVYVLYRGLIAMGLLGVA